jgi:hypothetical protein
MKYPMLVTKINVTYIIKIDYGWNSVPCMGIWIISPRNHIQAFSEAHAAYPICTGVPFPKAKRQVLKVGHFSPCSDRVKAVCIFISTTHIRLRSIFLKNI